MSLVQTERVLVVSTHRFRQLGYFQGFCGNPERYLDELLDPQNTSYRPRSDMEEDPSFKQLIPYVIFRHIDDAGVSHVFCYRRGSGQGEQRLHRKRSIGIGGHISSDDVGASGEMNPYMEGMKRELNEEVYISTPYRETCVGLINDDQSEVGQVHLGVVHILDVERPAVQPREKEIIEAGFSAADELLADRSNFENWSQICLDVLFSS